VSRRFRKSLTNLGTYRTGGTSSLFGLAPCGVCPARNITATAVRSYRTFSPLPRRRSAPALQVRIHNDGGAVCFLWHFPSTGLEPGLPDVIRHTALWSSDFPLPLGGATVRSSCLPIHYRRTCSGCFPGFRNAALSHNRQSLLTGRTGGRAGALELRCVLPRIQYEEFNLVLQAAQLRTCG
jgi:hypothetical protein